MYDSLTDSALGKKSTYTHHYAPELLFAVPRAANRYTIGIDDTLPFYGYDVWNAYEISWLNSKGKPMVALGEFIVPCTSVHLVESKSLKLYLNSFNNTRFDTVEKVTATIQHDLSNIAGERVTVQLHTLSQRNVIDSGVFTGRCLDALDVTITEYTVNPELLIVEDAQVNEVLYSDLLKSNCPITGQPDWASVQIIYNGKKINHERLLQYFISFRDYNEFHEHCVERIFMDIKRRCNPTALTVTARFTRRGGIDINPVRTTEPNFPYRNQRLWRQ